MRLRSPFDYIHRVLTRRSRREYDALLHQLGAYHALDGKSSAELDQAMSAALERSRGYVMSQAECDNQIVNFVWGNAPEDEQSTRDTVRANIRHQFAV